MLGSGITRCPSSVHSPGSSFGQLDQRNPQFTDDVIQPQSEAKDIV